MSSDPFSFHILRKIDRVCDSYEAAWNAGLAPKIEDFLDATTLVDRDKLLSELIMRDVELRRKQGQSPEADDYLERFHGVDAQRITMILETPSQAEGFSSEAIAVTQQMMETSNPSGPTVLDPNTGEGNHVAKPLPVAAPPQAPAMPPPIPAIEPEQQAAADLIVLPEKVGRFRVERHLGQGNFLVILARDENGQDVAIKLPRPGDPKGRRRLVMLAEEAQRLAALDHPAIVKFLEMVPIDTEAGSEELGSAGYIVLEYVPGTTLEDRFVNDRPEPRTLAEMMVQIAEAVHYAHTMGQVHRDLKPRNILIDLQGRPKVCDFGLAVDEEIQRLKKGQVAGTINYMAPEQVRGETNKLDGRTDIWALGVILYRGLTGQLPFRGRGTAECFDEILHREPKPPRQFSNGIPRELERICLRCLSTTMSDRYLTARDLAEELRGWLAEENREHPAPATGRSATPRGLRNFNTEDGQLFLRLLPGPRGSDGLPESVRFWKMRIEAAASGRPFGVALIYGPSGAGKSSFVRAGLLAHLDPSRVRYVLLDARPIGLEAAVLAALRARVPQLPGDCDLADAIAMIRDERRMRPKEKLLLVIDQFEQWLQGRQIDPYCELVRALRHCDGRHVQVLLLVRDDFWTATTHLFNVVECPLEVNENATAIELFDGRHGRAVLKEFGEALGTLPKGEIAPDSDFAQFLELAIAGLKGSDGRIIPARLSLFVEVVRHRPWTLKTLESLGGMDGFEVRFLEDAFGSPSAQPAHRQHRQAAEAVLQRLLPASEEVIRGEPQSRGELLKASGYASDSKEFADLIQILDRDLKLITAVDGRSLAGGVIEGATAAAPDSAPVEGYYNLAHDYLIRPIRQWAEGKLMATREGRARLRLRAVTRAWLNRPTARQLPSVLEYVSILWRLKPSSWNAQEAKVMRAAANHYLGIVLVLGLLISSLVVGWTYLLDTMELRTTVSAALMADDRQLYSFCQRLKAYEGRVVPEIQRAVSLQPGSERRPLVERMLTDYFTNTLESQRELASMLIQSTEPNRAELLCRLIADQPSETYYDEFNTILSNESDLPVSRLRAACGLNAVDPGQQHPQVKSPAIARALLKESGRNLTGWIQLLGKDSALLVDPLGEICRNESNASTAVSAAEALAEVIRQNNDPVSLMKWLLVARNDAVEKLIGVIPDLNNHGRMIEFLTAETQQAIPAGLAEDQRFELERRQATAALSLHLLGRPEAVSRILRMQTNPELRSILIDRLANSTRNMKLLQGRLPEAPDSTELQALLMIHAESPITGFEESERASILESARRHFIEHPDSGVHSAAELLIRRWGSQAILEKAVAEVLARQKAGIRPEFRWMIGPEGHTLAILPAPEVFLMGSPENEPERFAVENQYYCKIGRRIAVGTKEVTVPQLRRFNQKYPLKDRNLAGPDSSANLANWFIATAYCNWLTKQDPSIPDDQLCYQEPVKEDVEKSIWHANETVITPGDLEKIGYRLPTEAEWEYFARAGTSTPYFFGGTQTLLPRYGWTWLTSDARVSPPGLLLPNRWGLFDTVGNLWEWCHDCPQKKPLPGYPLGSSASHPVIDRPDEAIVDSMSHGMLRGGAFNYAPSQARSAQRYQIDSTHVEGSFGFRVVRTLPMDTPRN